VSRTPHALLPALATPPGSGDANGEPHKPCARVSREAFCVVACAPRTDDATTDEAARPMSRLMSCLVRLSCVESCGLVSGSLTRM
jgi:hypothetical protein